MHRVRRELLERQATSLGLPLQFICLPAFPPNSLYEDRVCAALRPFLPQGVRRAVFGDLFLGDIRAWRDALMRPLGMEAWYPLWGRDTTMLAREFLRRRFRAALVCVDARRLDARRLDASFAGREFDAALLRELPASVDPCGENGEFHTFAFDGPGFTGGPVAFTRGEVAVQGDFVYQDLVPVP